MIGPAGCRCSWKSSPGWCRSRERWNEAKRASCSKTMLKREIPATLQDLMMARLDRMEGEREVAQLAATLGREFSYELLAAVATMDEPTLQAELAKLVQAEILYSKGKPPRLQLHFQARSAGRCGIQLAGKGKAAAIPQASCGGAGGAVSADCRDAAGVACAPFHGSGSGGEGGWLLAEGRASIAGPVGERGGDRPSDKRTGAGRHIPRVARARCQELQFLTALGPSLHRGPRVRRA